MFARLMIGTSKMDKLDDAVRIYKESIIPVAKSQKGYRDAYLLIDRKTGKEVSISLWDSEKDAEDAIATYQKNSYLQEQISHLRESLTVGPVREGYEVSVQDLK